MFDPSKRAVRNRFVFVAGLHRTGTSLLARIIGSHPKVSSIADAPVPENEGCYLQGGIPHTALHGRPGHFATNPAEHHTETSQFNTLETRQRMLADWSGWFEPTAPWWLEKSPVNLTRMRLYQQLFPTCQFVVILRHPQVMAAALAKWTDRSPGELLDYGLDAYDRMREDVRWLHGAVMLRYEDLVARPDDVRRALFAFFSLDDVDPEIGVRDGNADYVCDAPIDHRQEQRLAQWGYRPGGETIPWQPLVAHPLRSVSEAVALELAATSPVQAESLRLAPAAS